MAALARLIAWLNVIGNGLFGWLEKPMTVLPAWLSLTVISAVLGVLMLMVFKYTSNQPAIGRARDQIKAHLLAMKLFKDNIPVVLRSQAKIFLSALLLLVHSFRPMVVMIVPFSLLLGQLSLWYQSRPLTVGEQTVVTMQLANSDTEAMPTVSLALSAAAEVVIGPVRVPSKRQVYWQIQATRAGYHQLEFNVGDTQVQKQLAVGVGLMSVSIARPPLDVVSLILHPAEEPFGNTSPVRSITLNYPDCPSKLTGTDVWIISLFVISMAVAFGLKPFFNVKF